MSVAAATAAEPIDTGDRTLSGHSKKVTALTIEADYSYRIYCKGALLVNWVAFYSVYPTIHGNRSNQTAASDTAAAPAYVKK